MSPMIESQFPRFGVSFEREDVRVETMYPQRVPDEEWRVVDTNGHGHFWKDGELPTLDKVKIGEQYVGDEIDGEVYPVYEYRCSQCEEVIEPGYTLKYRPSHVPGLLWITVTFTDPPEPGTIREPESHRLTPEQYLETVNGWRDLIREVVRR